MAQFRLTAKFANDCGIKSLTTPHQQPSILDDWTVDVLTIKRRKVAVAIHAKSLLVFFIPYSSIGGAKNVLASVKKMLYAYLCAHGYNNYPIKVEYENFVNSPITLCKTDSRKLLGHLNDFKRCLEITVHGETFDAIPWNQIMVDFQKMPVNVTHSDSSFPEKMFRELITQAF